jgi:deoxyribonuclease V
MTMKKIRHRWNLTPREAIALQQRLRAHVIVTDQLGSVRHVAGTDVGFERDGRVTRAAVAVLSFPALALVDCAIARLPTRFPYVPGLLSFREIPALLAAFDKLQTRPDLILCDGQGVAHPRRCGLASHIGLACGIPSIGVAKTRLIGEHRVPPQRRGAWAPLTDRGETIGAALRSRRGVKPIYVSIGHRVCLATAIKYAMACTGPFRLPETTRWAHRLASGDSATISPELPAGTRPKRRRRGRSEPKGE